MATGSTPEVRYCSQCGQANPVDQLARFGDELICPNCKTIYIQKLREGVAPVQPVFRYAGFWIRFLAILIDGIILGVVGSAVQLLLMGRALGPLAQFQPNLPPDQAMAAFGSLMGMLGLSTLINVAIAACYEGFFVARIGATPGKMALSLKVVRADGAPLTLGRSFGRYFAKWLNYFTLLIGFIMAGFDAQKRALHDMICDTRVIKVDSSTSPYSRRV